MVRAAQDSGGGELLLPSGCHRIDDTPADFFDAFSYALTIIGWQRNLAPDEVPPRWMWPFGDELEQWFEEVDAARKEKYGGGADAIENASQNEYAMERFGDAAR